MDELGKRGDVALALREYTICDMRFAVNIVLLKSLSSLLFSFLSFPFTSLPSCEKRNRVSFLFPSPLCDFLSGVSLKLADHGDDHV